MITLTSAHVDYVLQDGSLATSGGEVIVKPHGGIKFKNQEIADKFISEVYRLISQYIESEEHK